MNLVDPIHQHSEARPNEPAIISEQAVISWAQLDHMIWSTALRISEHGIKAGDCIGLSITHPVIHLITSLALAQMGVAHIAILATHSDFIRNDLLKKLKLTCIISDQEQIIKNTSNGIFLDEIKALPISSDQKQDLSCSNEDLPWLILQSSGTTGNPKFAYLNYQAAYDRFTRFVSLFKSNQHDIFWAASRPDFVVAKQRLLFNLLAGSAICLPTNNIITRDLLYFLNKHQITLACGTPFHLHQLLMVGMAIPSLRAFEVRSAVVSEKIRQQFKAIISKNLFVVYGTNEGEALTLATPSLQIEVPNTVGIATKSITLEVVDDEGLQVPPYKTGEVRVQGPGVIASYIRDPESSTKSFKNGWFYPGDLGFLTENGALILQGRKDNMMIFDGINIYPAEIETILSEHLAVNEVVAFGIDHDQLQSIPIAAVTINQSISERELIEYCKVRLGIKYPRRIFILKDLPKNSMGKVLIQDLVATVFINKS